MARSQNSAGRGRGHSLRKRRRDSGAILILWAICLPALLGLLIGAIQLGNLLQSSDNARYVADANAQNAADAKAQNVADAAALAASSYLATIHPTGPMVVQSIPIDCQPSPTGPPIRCKCRVAADGTITGCASYVWLNGYYIYEGEDWLAIGTQVSGQTALQDASGAWACGSLGSGNGNHGYCTELDVAPLVPGYVDGSLSDGETISQAITATATAISVETQNGFTVYSGCAPPPQFLLAEGPTAQDSTGVSCVGYDAAGTIWVSVLETFTLPGVGLATDEKWALATVVRGTAVLCPGPPPSGQCN